MNDFLNWRYWLNPRPGSLEPTNEKIMIGFLVLLFATAFLITVLKKQYKKNPYRKTIEKIGTFVWTNLVIGVFLNFFIYELVPYLSMRFLLAIWIVGMIVWVIFIGKTLKIIPKIKEEKEREKEFKKYIP